MTPTRWKYLGLKETERANRAHEELQEQANRIATVKIVVDGVTNVLKAFLPFGLDVVKWKSSTRKQQETALHALEAVKEKGIKLPDKEFALYKSLKAALKGGKH